MPTKEEEPFRLTFEDVVLKLKEKDQRKKKKLHFLTSLAQKRVKKNLLSVTTAAKLQGAINWSLFLPIIEKIVQFWNSLDKTRISLFFQNKIYQDKLTPKVKASVS